MKKEAVPKRDEKPIHGLVSDKNFIVANAVENILAGKCSPSFISQSPPSYTSSTITGYGSYKNEVTNFEF